MKLKQSILAAAMLMAAAVPMQAQAATATATMQVSGTVVLPTANVTVAGPLAFGNVVKGQLGTATTSYDVTVTNGVSYTVDFGLGLNGNTGFAGSFYLVDTAFPPTTAQKYTLFTDSTKATKYVPGTGTTINSIGTGAVQTYGVYGEFTPDPTSAAHTYTDTITITVTY